MKRMNAVFKAPPVCWVICIMLVILTRSSVAVSNDETLTLIKNVERKFTTADFSVKARIYSNPEKNSKPFGSYHAEVQIEFGTVPKYKIDTRSTLPTDGRGQSDIGYTGAFDGDSESAIRYGTDLKPHSGHITSNADKNSFGIVSSAGARYFLSMFEGVGLTSFLNSIPESLPDWTTVDPLGEDNKLTVWAPNYHNDPEHKKKRSFVVTLDFSRSGNIVKLIFYENYGTSDEFLYRTVEVKEFKEIDGLWVPSVIESDQPGEYGSFNFDWRRINFTPREAEFHLEFPAGLRVYDEVRDVRYVVGETAPDK